MNPECFSVRAANVNITASDGLISGSSAAPCLAKPHQSQKSSSLNQIKDNRMQTVHVTVWRGEPIQLVRCMQCCNKYHCPFCRPEVFKPTAGSKLLKHIRAHEKRAVQFRDYVIFKCNLTCRSYSHFHCPTCIKVVDKRGRFLSHLEKCVTETPYAPLCKADGHYLHIKEEPESYDGSDEEKDHPATEEDKICKPVRKHKAPLTNLQHSASSSTTGDLRIRSEDRVQKVSSEKENTPVQHSACSDVENNSGRGAVISLQISQGSTLFKHGLSFC